jgi:hypothetical protein
VQFRNGLVEFRLEEVARNGVAQSVLLGELLRRELPPVAVGVALVLLAESHFPGLLVQEENVAVQAGVFRGARADVLGQYLPFGEIGGRDVDHQPVVPLPHGCWDRLGASGSVMTRV